MRWIFALLLLFLALNLSAAPLYPVVPDNIMMFAQNPKYMMSREDALFIKGCWPKIIAGQAGSWRFVRIPYGERVNNWYITRTPRGFLTIQEATNCREGIWIIPERDGCPAWMITCPSGSVFFVKELCRNLLLSNYRPPAPLPPASPPVAKPPAPPAPEPEPRKIRLIAEPFVEERCILSTGGYTHTPPTDQHYSNTVYILYSHTGSKVVKKKEECKPKPKPPPKEPPTCPPGGDNSAPPIGDTNKVSTDTKTGAPAGCTNPPAKIPGNVPKTYPTDTVKPWGGTNSPGSYTVTGG